MQSERRGKKGTPLCPVPSVFLQNPVDVIEALMNQTENLHQADWDLFQPIAAT